MLFLYYLIIPNEAELCHMVLVGLSQTQTSVITFPTQQITGMWSL